VWASAVGGNPNYPMANDGHHGRPIGAWTGISVPGRGIKIRRDHCAIAHTVDRQLPQHVVWPKGKKPRKVKRNDNYFGVRTFGVLTVNVSLQYPNLLGSSSREIGRLSVESPSSPSRRGSRSRRTIQSPPNGFMTKLRSLKDVSPALLRVLRRW
jgi:hypothetical protein